MPRIRTDVTERRMPWAASIATALCGVLVGVAPVDAADLVLLGARCVDPFARETVERSLWISDGVLRAMGDPQGEGLPPESEGVPRWDVEGAHLVPLFEDAWVYGGTQRSPGHRDELGVLGTSRCVLAAGVARYVDVLAPHERGEGAVDLASVGVLAARRIAGGPLVTAPGGVALELPGAVGIRDAAAMVALVDSLANVDPERRTRALVLVFDGSRREPRLPVDVLAAGLTRAENHGLRVAVQVGTWRDVYDALENGARWIVQLPFGPVPELVRQRLAGLDDVFWTPLLALGQDFVRLTADPSLREDPLFAAIVPESLREDFGGVRLPQQRYADMAERRRIAFENLAILLDSGVRLRVGSGSGALGTAHGWTLLRELEWLAEAGVDPWRVLAAAVATTGAGSGAETAYRVGAPLDLLVVGRSPVEDVRALRELEALIVGGERVDPRAVAASVSREIVEELPPDPMPFGGRVPLVVIVVAGFTVLLLLRRAVKRAAAQAESSSP